jgi:hypothetical protein
LKTLIQEEFMARRRTGHMNGERYLANTNPSKLEVHDLDNENNNCQIDEIIKAGNDKPYNWKYEANRDGFDNCYWCIGDSNR